MERKFNYKRVQIHGLRQEYEYIFVILQIVWHARVCVQKTCKKNRETINDKIYGRVKRTY